MYFFSSLIHRGSLLLKKKINREVIIKEWKKKNSSNTDSFFFNCICSLYGLVIVFFCYCWPLGLSFSFLLSIHFSVSKNETHVERFKFRLCPPILRQTERKRWTIYIWRELGGVEKKKKEHNAHTLEVHRLLSSDH
jgi:hypothetical protein